jgi:hypothetical protein
MTFADTFSRSVPLPQMCLHRDVSMSVSVVLAMERPAGSGIHTLTTYVKNNAPSITIRPFHVIHNPHPHPHHHHHPFSHDYGHSHPSSMRRLRRGNCGVCLRAIAHVGGEIITFWFAAMSFSLFLPVTPLRQASQVCRKGRGSDAATVPKVGR